MSLDKNAFPLRDIDKGEELLLRELVGGERLDGALVESFLRTGRLPFVRNRRLLGLLGSTSTAVLAEVDDPTGNAKAALIKGALFYAGTFRKLSQTPDLPIKGGVITEVKRLSTPNLIVRASESIDGNPRFRSLLDAVMGAVQLSSAETVAHVGAGALHLALEGSAHSANSELTAYENDPGLADLQELFAGFGQ